ncbi:MAG: ISAs1 family transposase [Parahaliea sp.]
MRQNTPLLEWILRLKDPRQAAKCTHNLGEVVFMTTCALLCGADDWNGIELLAHEREDWFRQYLQLPGGVPSHDTFNRLFSLLDPGQFRGLFTTWVQDVPLVPHASATAIEDARAAQGGPMRWSRPRQMGGATIRHQRVVALSSCGGDIGVFRGTAWSPVWQGVKCQ